jgi:outer membrane protein assembly factor BamB
VPGRARTYDVNAAMAGLTAADLDGDGVPEALCVRENRDGSARLVTLDLEGRERWGYDFPGFGGSPPVWNENGANYWTVGHLASRDHLAVLISNRPNIMNSDQTTVLDLPTGKVLWERRQVDLDPVNEGQGVWIRHYGGSVASLGDLTGDGLDDVVMGCLPLVDGATGTQLTRAIASLVGFVFLAADMNGDGVAEVLTATTSQLHLGKLGEGKLSTLWTAVGGTTATALGDTDGDGRPELGVPGTEGGFLCLDVATGAALWSIPEAVAAARASNCVCGDVNGDGKEEFVFASGARLIAAARREGAASNILWQLDLPAIITEVVVADADGDGQAEILCGGINGVLYCVP